MHLFQKSKPASAVDATNDNAVDAIVDAEVEQQQQYNTIDTTIVVKEDGGSVRPGMGNKQQSVFENLAPVNELPMPALTEHQQKVYARLQRIQYAMDDCITIPVINRKVGIDPIIGMLPIVGDFGSAFVSVLFVAGASTELSKYTIVRMLVNVGIDGVVGIVPLAGDIFDFGWKANERNLAIFEDNMKCGNKTRGDTDKWWMLKIILAFVLICTISTVLTVGLVVMLVLYLTRDKSSS